MVEMFGRAVAGVSSIVVFALLCSHAYAQQTVRLDIVSQPLSEALRELGTISNTNIMFEPGMVSGIVAPALKGDITAREALTRLLSGTKWSFKFVDENTVSLVPRSSSETAQTDASVELDHRLSVAQSEQSLQKIEAGASPPSTTAGNATALEQTATAGLDEIVVTATKREERVQDIPMSIAVIGSQDIERRSLTGMSDYLRTVPGVSNLDFGVARNVIVIRGISIDPNLDGFNTGQSVGSYFGEIPLSGLRFGPADLKLVDISRIEVLRGPQGTLYGAGSLSGAVRNIPVAPNLQEFEGTVEAGYSETGRYGGGNSVLKGIVNLPVSEGKLAIRLVGYRFEDIGFIRNVAASNPAFVANAALWGAGGLVVNQNHAGTAEYLGGRFSVLWQPTEQLSATLTYVSQDATQQGIPEVEISRGGSYTQTRLQLGEIIGGGPELLRDQTNIANLVINYDFPWGSLVSSSSYSEQKWTYNRDIFAFLGGIPSPQNSVFDNKAFSEEIRLVSNFDGRFQFVSGLYFEDVEEPNGGPTYFGGDPARAPFGLDPLGDLKLFDYLQQKELRQTAVFGELSYDLTRQITLSVGARRFNYDRSNAVYYSAPAFGTLTENTLDMDEDGESFKANLTYQPREQALLYAQWAQGFRFGKPIGPFLPTCDMDGDGYIDASGGVPMVGAKVESDRLDNYELGGKFAMFENRVTVNASVYHIDWTGLPIGLGGRPPCASVYFVNAGKALSRGIELESSFALTRNLRLNMGGSLLKVELNGDAPGIGVDGDRLPGSPERQFNAGLEYVFKVSTLPAYFRGDYSYVGSFFTRTGERGDEVSGFGLLSARIGVAINRVEVSLFGSNLMNSDDLAWGSPLGTGFQLKPRTVGANATIRF